MFSIFPISEVVNLTLNAFSIERRRRICVRLSQPTTSLAVK